MSSSPQWNRVLLKLSGEAFAGGEDALCGEAFSSGSDGIYADQELLEPRG